MSAARPSFRLAAPIFLLMALAGCSSIGGGRPPGQSQVTIVGVPKALIEMKAEEVFYRHGFSFKGATANEMVFERDGGTLDNILYGNWQEKDTYTKVTLFLTPADSGDAYHLRLRSEVVRDTFGEFVDEAQFDLQGAKYSVILDKIKSEAEDL